MSMSFATEKNQIRVIFITLLKMDLSNVFTQRAEPTTVVSLQLTLQLVTPWLVGILIKQ